jgi:hypothetical protein
MFASNGDLYASGESLQVGNWRRKSERWQKPRELFFANKEKPVHVGCGGLFSGFVTEKGELYMWGKEINKYPTKIGIPEFVTDFSAGLYHSFMPTKSGNIYSPLIGPAVPGTEMSTRGASPLAPLGGIWTATSLSMFLLLLAREWLQSLPGEVFASLGLKRGVPLFWGENYTTVSPKNCSNSEIIFFAGTMDP